MEIQVLSNRKYNKYLGTEEYTKREVKEVNSFLYDEDVLWFEYGKKRFGINLEEVRKMRRKLLRYLNKEINK